MEFFFKHKNYIREPAVYQWTNIFGPGISLCRNIVEQLNCIQSCKKERKGEYMIGTQQQRNCIQMVRGWTRKVVVVVVVAVVVLKQFTINSGQGEDRVNTTAA